ncbi:MAG: hypothetical protein R3E67_04775 [Pseudomonadales bacterium]
MSEKFFRLHKKCWTQNHWDTEEAFAPPAETPQEQLFPVLCDADGVKSWSR